MIQGESNCLIIDINCLEKILEKDCRGFYINGNLFFRFRDKCGIIGEIPVVGDVCGCNVSFTVAEGCDFEEIELPLGWVYIDIMDSEECIYSFKEYIQFRKFLVCGDPSCPEDPE